MLSEILFWNWTWGLWCFFPKWPIKELNHFFTHKTAVLSKYHTRLPNMLLPVVFLFSYVVFYTLWELGVDFELFLFWTHSKNWTTRGWIKVVRLSILELNLGGSLRFLDFGQLKNWTTFLLTKLPFLSKTTCGYLICSAPILFLFLFVFFIVRIVCLTGFRCIKRSFLMKQHSLLIS